MSKHPVSGKYIGNFLKVPTSLIKNLDMSNWRVALYSYCMIRRGLDNRLEISINDLVTGMKRAIQKGNNGNNKQFQTFLDELVNHNYIQRLDNCSKCHYSTKQWFYIPDPNRLNDTVIFDDGNSEQSFSDADDRRFAPIYVDEAQKILDCKWIRKDTLFLLLSYLRLNIFSRNTELDNDTKANPEVCLRHLNTIANEIGISVSSVRKGIDVLIELGVIRTYELPKIKQEYSGRTFWYNNGIIFCNAYRRRGTLQIAEGEDYYKTEIKNRINHIASTNKSFRTGSEQL